MKEVTRGDPLREAAEALQDYMTANVDPVDCPVKHYFAPGMYLREMTIPEGVVVVGAVHKHEHLAILSKGTLRLSTEDGVIEFTAPATIHSYPGIKRIAYALTDVVITTMHHNPTNTQDHEELTRLNVDVEQRELLEGANNLQALHAERRKELACPGAS